MAKKKTHEEYVAELKKVNPNVEPLENYIQARKPIKHKCKICGYEWDLIPTNALKPRGCPACHKKKKRTPQEYCEDVQNINPNIVPLENFVNVCTPIKHKCLICGDEWNGYPSNILKGEGCPGCAGSKKSNTIEYKQKLSNKQIQITPLEKYVNAHKEILHKCDICGHEWYVKPNNILSGKGCPKCAYNSSSYQDERAYEFLSEFYPQTRYRDKSLIGMELDIVIPELKIAFEPGNWYFHCNKVGRDALKREMCEAKGYTCYTLYDGYPIDTPPPFNERCLVIPWNNGQNKDKYDVILQNLKELWEVTQCQS